MAVREVHICSSWVLCQIAPILLEPAPCATEAFARYVLDRIIHRLEVSFTPTTRTCKLTDYDRWCWMNGPPWSVIRQSTFTSFILASNPNRCWETSKLTLTVTKKVLLPWSTPADARIRNSPVYQSVHARSFDLLPEGGEGYDHLCS